VLITISIPHAKLQLGSVGYMSKKYSGWKRRTIGVFISVSIAEGVGILSALLTKDTMGKYKELQQPLFSPPGWVFPIVWSILFLMMGIASYLIYYHGFEKAKVKNALVFYEIQLAFNFFWTIIFFRFGLRGFALLWILILLSLIVLAAVKFYKIDKIAAYLMTPYILWVSFASILNFSIWQLNK